MKFSERVGISKIDTALQVQGMNDDLRNSLWNVLDLLIWQSKDFITKQYGIVRIQDFSSRLWFNFFKLPIDSRPKYGDEILEIIREHFFNGEWYDVYAILEYVLAAQKDQSLIKAINKILERELSGYRFINSAFVPVTDELELEAVEKAISEGPFSGVHGHLNQEKGKSFRMERSNYNRMQSDAAKPRR